jgi:hypothetical protein
LKENILLQDGGFVDFSDMYKEESKFNSLSAEEQAVTDAEKELLLN